MSRDAFGPNLRRLRIQRGVTLEQIARTTKIASDLLTALERNDFSRWPEGIYARAYIRQYAYAIGADPDSTVDEFCRWFSQGDRRAERVVREHAEIVGHAPVVWEDQVRDGDRRGATGHNLSLVKPQPAQSALSTFVVRLRRAFGRA
jgi:transcriptional regulator with XRE-family HTH domain